MVIGVPVFVNARSQGIKFSRIPTIIEAKNSQNMALLEGHLSTTPISTVTPHLAIVDNSALSPESDQGVVFADAGKAGGGQISVYIVHKGDTLPAIAKMFGVSTNTIVWANDIKGGKISEGQELVILPISGVKHTVKKGDTLKSIAAKYKADINDILAFNDVLINSKLNVGDVIIVPDGEVSVSISSSSSSNKQFNSLPTIAGYYMKPINGGRRSQGIHGHNGVDLADRYGAPIYAAADGVVIIARTGWNGGYGTYVVISHPNGTQTLYGHMSKLLVSSGQNVKQGQQIGNMGSTGKSTGNHLHFEVRGAKNPF